MKANVKSSPLYKTVQQVSAQCLQRRVMDGFFTRKGVNQLFFLFACY